MAQNPKRDNVTFLIGSTLWPRKSKCYVLIFIIRSTLTCTTGPVSNQRFFWQKHRSGHPKKMSFYRRQTAKHTQQNTNLRVCVVRLLSQSPSAEQKRPLSHRPIVRRNWNSGALDSLCTGPKVDIKTYHRLSHIHKYIHRHGSRIKF